jgi:HAD superfamily hydrolase (TIGR01493 family)
MIFRSAFRLVDEAGRADRTAAFRYSGQSWKPAPEPYRHAAKLCGVPPRRMALVAARGWDIHGARHAG